jgi:hypothetical protein
LEIKKEAVKFSKSQSLLP